MSIRDAARASGLSPKALRRRIERGTLGSVLVGGRRRIPVDDLVRRGLVPDAVDPLPTEHVAGPDDQATMARRLRALESRVTALESVIDAAGHAGSPEPAPLRVDSDRAAAVGREAARATVAAPSR